MGVSTDNKPDLIMVPERLNAAKYIDDILTDHVLPAAISMEPAFLYQQDNARPDTAVATKNFLEKIRILVMNSSEHL